MSSRIQETVDAPLILTAQLPPDLHAWATGLRTRHFPPERNYLDAHVTLFHALPGQVCAEVVDCCKALAGEYAPVSARLSGVISLGKGTALKIESSGMIHVRDRIAERFHGMLTGQDQHHPRLHITIQNKVSQAEAKALQRNMESALEPRDFAFRGLALFYYRGGPWEPIRDFAFRGREAI